jgi:ATP-dependent DNA ligase
MALALNADHFPHQANESPPSGPLWLHEFKHDGYRLTVRWDGSRVRCFTRNGHDWANRLNVRFDPCQGREASAR